jgi:cyclic 2,3-diphosphoglycerate synthetase
VRALVLFDGEHYPSVVRDAVEHLPLQLPGCQVVGASLLGGTEKLVAPPDLGVPVVSGDTPDEALVAALSHFRPDVVIDLADEPVVDARTRLRLAARALAAGVSYQGPDFRFDAPPRPAVAEKPSITVIGTGKRTGKTAVAAHLARTLAERGTPPVIVAMGRGGPPAPELIDPATTDLTPAGLVALADQGRHAASDHLEDALMARVATVGTWRCGGGLAGTPAATTFAEGVRCANERPESLLVLEGSGQAIPPVRADATVLVVPADADPELVTGYLGAYRVLLADLVVITMCETSHAVLGVLERDVRGLAPGARVVHTVFRPFPLLPISGRRVVYATTAPAPVLGLLRDHLEREHGATVVGTSHHLADRHSLAADLEAAGEAEVLVVELKAAAVDLATRVALERGMEVVYCDNRVVSVGGDGPFEAAVGALADLATQRFHAGSG